MLIYIRHGDDDEEGSTYKHDAKLTNRGKRKCVDKMRSLIREQGIPKYIVCSPFERTKETAKIFLKDILKHYNVKVKLKIDPDLGRYFTSQDRKDPEMRSSTKKYQPIIDLNEEAMMERIKNHIEKYNAERYNPNGYVLLISHGIIIKRCLRLVKYKSPEHIPFLKSYIIKGK